MGTVSSKEQGHCTYPYINSSMGTCETTIGEDLDPVFLVLQILFGILLLFPLTAAFVIIKRMKQKDPSKTFRTRLLLLVIFIIILLLIGDIDPNFGFRGIFSFPFAYIPSFMFSVC